MALDGVIPSGTLLGSSRALTHMAPPYGSSGAVRGRSPSITVVTGHATLVI